MKKWTFTLLIALVSTGFFACRSSRDVQQPEFRDISNVRISDVSLFKTTAGADIIYYNPNDFSIQLTNARGDVYLDNNYLGRFELSEKVQVHRNSEFVLPVKLKLDNISTIKNNTEIYKKKEALVRIEGYAQVKKSGFSKEIPIRYEQIQSLDRLRALVAR